MSDYNYYDIQIDDKPLLPFIQDPYHIGRNLYSLEGSNDDDDQLLLCHVPTFMPFSEIDASGNRRYFAAGFGFSVSASTLMAIHHWNNGIGKVVKDIEGINNTCPIRFTTEIFDTVQSPVHVTKDFLHTIKRSPGSPGSGNDRKNLQPCAVLGPIRSAVATKFVFVTNLYETLHVAPGASSTELDDEETYPLFTRSEPTIGSSAINAVHYFTDHLKLNRTFAIVYTDDPHDETYHEEIQREADKLNKTTLSIQLSTEELRAKDTDYVKRKLQRISEQHINYVITAFDFDDGEFQTVMEGAYELGVAGPGNLWLFCGTPFTFRLYFNSAKLPKGSAVYNATFGNAILVDKGGAPGIAGYDSFVEEWKKFGANNASFEYLESKLPPLNGEQNDYSQYRKIFDEVPYQNTIYGYDAIIALGLSACTVAKNSSASYFTSEEHYKALLNVDFSSASGKVAFPERRSRDGSQISYTVANILEEQDDSLRGKDYLFFNLDSGKWNKYDENGEFFYAGNVTDQPREYIQTDYVLWYIWTSILCWILLLCFGYISIRAMKKLRLPSVRAVYNGELPNMDLPRGKNYHMFVSHVWRSGQSQTHAIVRKLQLYFPGIKIWLDVDHLEDIGDLETSVKESTVFVLFYSEGYFASKNCRREIETAIEQKKPIILVYMGDELTIEAMKVECVSNYLNLGNKVDSNMSEKILVNLLGDRNSDNCILWLNKASFSAVSLSRIYLAMLRNLPHYKNNPKELDQGLAVPHEQVPVRLKGPINLLVHSDNRGSVDIANELQLFTSSEKVGGKINIINTTDVFQDSVFGEDFSADFSKKNPSTHPTYEATPGASGRKQSYFLLYLNKETFNFATDADKMRFVQLINYCVSLSIKIVLVYEKDKFKGACSFNTFFAYVPQELIRPPIDLFNDIATPMYSNEHYRKVSMRLLLLKMGGLATRHRSGKWSIVQNISRMNDGEEKRCLSSSAINCRKKQIL